MTATIDTTPLLRMLKDSGQPEMLSRSHLNRHGIEDDVIVEADRRGEVIVSSGDLLASVLLTLEGDQALALAEAGR